ncbi:hypothetical protein IVA78_15175 [Bradyrhizobium sp. 137]|uniref:hypothetical protein n=1 Tax=Bradyrhizobium sp. 137 TaxID=2782614 RepID=UPI001FF992B2|nr:hypothetical protein [Bradyrhizobium sp. 137]MCK1756522.1 hypothetical protein [Bradyrhizobium sp. 137]
MLPGFRFLFAAILLSTSILVFGLGAAALLRASHEQYVSSPSWRNGPQEKMFAQAPEPAQPVLAVLRAEPEITADPAPSLRDQVPTIALPVSEPEPLVAATTVTDVQPDVTETAPQAQAPTAEPLKAETTPDAAAPAPTDTLTPADTTASIPETQPAAAVTVGGPPPADSSVAFDSSVVLTSSALDVAAAKMAALDAPATTAVKDAPAKPKAESTKTGSSASDSKATKRKAKVKKRHRVVRRPPPQQLQQQLDPFGQRQTLATTATRTRQ